MRAKTVIQKEVYRLSKKLPKINDEKLEWGYAQLFWDYCYVTKKEIECLECGHIWKNNTTKDILNVDNPFCPKCQLEVKPLEGRTRSVFQNNYFAIITTSKNYQVIRYFYMCKHSKAKNSLKKYTVEVCQNWINEKGKVLIVAKLRTPFASYNNSWSFGSPLEIRGRNGCHDINCLVHPKMKILPIIKRNGFDGDFVEKSALYVFERLLTNQYAETCYKAGQRRLFEVFSTHTYEGHWTQIKICIRNKYITNEPHLWIDHIRVLEQLGMDTYNPKYLCPENLAEEHNRLVTKLRRIQREKRIKEVKKSINEDEIWYKEKKGKYANIEISNGVIKLSVLKSVMDHYIEGEELKHCLFTNEYHKKENSIILSARTIDDERLETVEFSLTNKDVVQSYGLHNQLSQYHDEIINLIRKNKRAILKPKLWNSGK